MRAAADDCDGSAGMSDAPLRWIMANRRQMNYTKEYRPLDETEL
jgi:hypothetical protein